MKIHLLLATAPVFAAFAAAAPLTLSDSPTITASPTLLPRLWPYSSTRPYTPHFSSTDSYEKREEERIGGPLYSQRWSGVDPTRCRRGGEEGKERGVIDAVKEEVAEHRDGGDEKKRDLAKEIFNNIVDGVIEVADDIEEEIEEEVAEHSDSDSGETKKRGLPKEIFNDVVDGVIGIANDIEEEIEEHKDRNGDEKNKKKRHLPKEIFNDIVDGVIEIADEVSEEAAEHRNGGDEKIKKRGIIDWAGEEVDEEIEEHGGDGDGDEDDDGDDH